MDDSQDLRSGDPTGDPTQGGTAFAPWVLPMVQKSDFTKAFVDRILAHLSQLDESRAEGPGFNKVTRLEHCLQTATLAHQAGEGLEMVFFCTLRNQIHADLHGKPEMLKVKGLREAVHKLTGTKNWGPRSQKLNDQIVDYLRHIVSEHQQEAKLTLMIV